MKKVPQVFNNFKSRDCQPISKRVKCDHSLFLTHEKKASKETKRQERKKNLSNIYFCLILTKKKFIDFSRVQFVFSNFWAGDQTKIAFDDKITKESTGFNTWSRQKEDLTDNRTMKKFSWDGAHGWNYSLVPVIPSDNHFHMELTKLHFYEWTNCVRRIGIVTGNKKIHFWQSNFSSKHLKWKRRADKCQTGRFFGLGNLIYFFGFAFHFSTF